MASAEPLTEFEQDLVVNAHRFDLNPLVELLSENGYSYDSIRFESADDGRSTSLVRAVRFENQSPRVAVISVQWGLMGDNTLLPSYFHYVLRHARHAEGFLDFLRFFDHVLIQNLFWALHPERPDSPMGDWLQMQRAFLRLSIPASLSTLHGLIQSCFPDLGVRVRRYPFESSTTSEACWNGLSRLDGSGVLGRTYVTETAGYAVDLVAEEELDGSGRTWANVVLRRMDTQMLPLLAPYRLPLLVRLQVLAHKSWAHVDAPDGDRRGHLGYDRVRGGGQVEHTTVIYRGITGGQEELSISSWQ